MGEGGHQRLWEAHPQGLPQPPSHVPVYLSSSSQGGHQEGGSGGFQGRASKLPSGMWFTGTLRALNRDLKPPLGTVKKALGFGVGFHGFQNLLDLGTREEMQLMGLLEVLRAQVPRGMCSVSERQALLGHQPGRGKCDSPAPAAHPRLLFHGVSSVLTQGPGGPTRVLRVSVPPLCLESRDRFWAPSWALPLTPYY